MGFKRDSIYHTSLGIKVIDENKLGVAYPEISFGEEGTVYKYDKHIAMKIFSHFEDQEVINKKFEKIEELGQMKDKEFCFPKGIIGFMDLKKEGYGMELVVPNKKCANFNELHKLANPEAEMDYLLRGDRAIARIHKRNIVIGDVRFDHILINKDGEIRFCDTDNYQTANYDFDLIPNRSKWLLNMYHQKYSGIDNDIFVYTLLVLKHLIPEIKFNNRLDVEHIKKIIKLLDTDNEVKEGLSLILSDAPYKPYLTKVLKKINPNKPLITEVNLGKLR